MPPKLKLSKEKPNQKIFKRKYSWIKISLFIIWLSGFCAFGLQLVNRCIAYREAVEEYRKLNHIIWKNQEKNAITVNSPQSPDDYLKSLNPDYEFWLSIPGTSINYPVVRSRQAGYYLNHTFRETENPSGSLFIQKEAPVPGKGNTVIFGHNMKDGTMFAGLKKYKSNSFYKNHSIIKIYYEGRWLEAIVFSIQIRNEDNLDCYEAEFNNLSETHDFIRRMKASSLYPTAYLPSVSDPVITLSTCYGRTERMIVQAALICYTDK